MSRPLLLALGTLAAVLPLASTATAAAPRCTITGTPHADVLRGTPGPDVICGRGGNDVLRGGAGDDILRGGPGNDVLDGGPGQDVVDYADRHERIVRASAVDDHPIRLLQRPQELDQVYTPNCTASYGIGSGQCGDTGNRPIVDESNPAFGRWLFGWKPSSDGLAITIQSRDVPGELVATLHDRSRAELVVTSGRVPAWGLDSLVDQTGSTVRAGQPGGPLHINAWNPSAAGDRGYWITITGYLRYAKPE